MKLNENEGPGGFETPWRVELRIEWEQTSATDKKRFDWSESEEE